MDALAFSFAGLVVGVIVGMTGVGGGSLMTPLLIFVFGVKPHLAIGTDLLFAAVTKAGGAWHLARARRVDWPVVGALCLGSVPAALATVAALHHFGTTSAAVQRAMTATLGGALLLTSAATLYKALRGARRSGGVAAAGALDAADALRPRHPALPWLLGALIGTLVSLSSVGAGAIGVSALMLLYPRLALPRIVAADIAFAVPVTLIAGLGHAALGSVDVPMLAALLSGSLPGIWLGSHLVRRAPERLVRSLLSVLLAYAGAKLVAA